MKLDESLRVVVDSHKPCIAIACAVRSGEREPQVDAQTSVAIALKGAPPAHAITALIAIQTAYAHICKKIAKQTGMTDKDLHTVITEGVKQSLQGVKPTSPGSGQPGGHAPPGSFPPADQGG